MTIARPQWPTAGSCSSARGRTRAPAPRCTSPAERVAAGKRPRVLVARLTEMPCKQSQESACEAPLGGRLLRSARSSHRAWRARRENVWPGLALPLGWFCSILEIDVCRLRVCARDRSASWRLDRAAWRETDERRHRGPDALVDGDDPEATGNVWKAPVRTPTRPSVHRPCGFGSTTGLHWARLDSNAPANSDF